MSIVIVIVIVAASFIIISNVSGTSNQRGNRSGVYRRSGHSTVDPNLNSHLINNHSDEDIHRHHNHGHHHGHHHDHHHHDHGSSHSPSGDSSSGSDSGSSCD